MADLCLDISGVTLALLGWIVGIISCALPMWKVTAFIGKNFETVKTIWEGIWMSCVVQSTGQMQCEFYDSKLALTSDLQAVRALTVISIVLGVLGLLLSIMGAKCTNCLKEERVKARVMIGAGLTFICGGVLLLIPVCWVAYSIIRDLYNPGLFGVQVTEIGVSLYAGWVSCGLLLLGGTLLSCPQHVQRVYDAVGLCSALSHLTSAV